MKQPHRSVSGGAKRTLLTDAGLPVDARQAPPYRSGPSRRAGQLRRHGVFTVGVSGRDVKHITFRSRQSVILWGGFEAMFSYLRATSLVFFCVLQSNCGSDGGLESGRSTSSPESPTTCRDLVDLRGFLRPMDTAADLEAYVNGQKEALHELVAEHPDRMLQAGINLKKLVGQTELVPLSKATGLSGSISTGIRRQESTAQCPGRLGRKA